METKLAENSGITQERLARLGLTAVASNLEKLKIRARKMAIAYEHYRYVRPQQIAAFQERLKFLGNRYTYQQLAFTPLESYTKIPPENVLARLEEALGRKCFDRFEVAHIVEVKKDPLLFGLIEGCGDKFFIDQWDDDVKISDILKANEG